VEVNIISENRIITVIGGGTIGSGWTVFYALKGFKVHLRVSEKNKKQALERISLALAFLAEKNIIKYEEKRGLWSQIESFSDISQAAKGAYLIQESVAETYDIKKEVMEEIEKGAGKDALIASSTSGLSITKVQESMSYPERCFVGHPFNPPHLIPLVEIVGGEKTSETVIQEACDFYQSLNKIPVVLNKEVPGHIANRLAMALWREAIDLVVKGVASVEDVDKVVAFGPGLRWAVMGPHLSYHLGGGEGGLAHYLENIGPEVETWWKDMDARTTISENEKDQLVQGVKEATPKQSMTDLIRWRDDKLVELLHSIGYNL